MISRKMDAGKLVVARVDDGEELVASIKQLCAEHGIGSGVILSVIGAISEVEMINPKERRPFKTKVESQMEIVANGNVSQDNGTHFVHLHFVSAPEGSKALAGHLVSAKVMHFCEVAILECAGLGRKEMEGFKRLII